MRTARSRMMSTKGFLEESPGMTSSMRVMSMIALLASIGFGVLTLFHGRAAQNPNALLITFGFLVSAFAPKAIQKFAETKMPDELTPKP